MPIVIVLLWSLKVTAPPGVPNVASVARAAAEGGRAVPGRRAAVQEAGNVGKEESAVTGGDGAAAGAVDGPDGADTLQRAAGETDVGDGAVHLQRAVVDRRQAGVGFDVGQLH